MSVTLLRPILRALPDLAEGRPDPVEASSTQGLAQLLVQGGWVTPQVMTEALALHVSSGLPLMDVLQTRIRLPPKILYDALALQWSVSRIDPRTDPPDPRLIPALGPVPCLQHGLLPWRKVGDATVILTAHPDRFALHAALLAATFGKVAMAVASHHDIQTTLLQLCGPDLAKRAENRVAGRESCRHLQAAALRRPALAALAMVTGLFWLSPAGLLLGLIALALTTMFAFSALKLLALCAVWQDPPTTLNPPVVARLPVVSVMVALYRESDIAARLTQRLGRLDYPRDLLDVLLVVEVCDHITRTALDLADLPVWMRIVVVPEGSIKTKPRALNYALDHCRGSIVGIYDAEDAPEPDQIRKVVQRFHEARQDVVCLQGILDFYNPHSNWLARCFTIEYAAWFRVFLPGIERLGLAVPLGGTTVFFRRAALEKLGGWDAQNVTEDADLGLRLARHGLRTELIRTTTFEEANCRARPWVKQRSRWVKGYMMTWLCHMRDPRLLWRQLGPRKFVGFQILFIGSILQTLLAPLLWSFWMIPLGLWHPVPAHLGHGAFVTLFMAMFAVQALTIAVDLRGLLRTQHRLSPMWVPTLMVYHMLATLSVYKALWELLTRPFYWDKTSHGHFDT